MKKVVAFLVALPLYTFCLSQQIVPKKSIAYYGIHSLGLLNGSKSASFTLQSINGIKWGQWSTGIGVALDNYAYRTIPLFLDIRRNLIKGNITPFIYANTGISFALRTDDLPEKWSNGQNANTLHNGLYYETGIGISKKLTLNNEFLLSIGYSYKKFSYTQEPFWWSTPVPGYLINTYSFNYRRIAVKISIAF